ncbi:hypothetical protein DL770_011654 [Monosporascus sp. CRB-9-2]|nr:hypothetical protein DL770_011654 [Monosporascus sp. CRB-9-2]
MLNSIKQSVAEELHQRLRAHSEPNFGHSRLSAEDGTAFIRLIELDGERSGGLLQCRLRHIDLNTQPPPQYDAVSYSWRKDVLGGQLNFLLSAALPEHFSHYKTEDQGARTRIVLCNGRALRIQRNLHDLLSRLQRQRYLSPLWVDAICIDQDETDEGVRNEKFRQLQLMGRIYESARTVLVWLGESDNISLSLPKLLRDFRPLQPPYEHFRMENDVTRLRHRPSALRVLLQMTGIDGSGWLSSGINVINRGYTLQALIRLINRDYFHRAWVVQELVLARSLRFLVGELEFTADDLLSGICTIIASSQTPLSINARRDSGGFMTMPHILQARADRLAGRPWSFDDFLFVCRDRQASRPEDKVMSILGLLSESENQRHKLLKDVRTADGNIRLAKLYANCAGILAGESGWPYVLSLVASGAAMSTDLPSWVPDLRVPLHPKPFWFFGCTHYSAATSVVPAEFTVIPPESGGSHQLSLSLLAAYVDEIVQVGESSNELEIPHVIDAEGHMLSLLSKLGRTYASTDELTLDAAMRTLTGDAFKHDKTLTLAELREGFASWIQYRLGNMGDKLPKIIRCMVETVTHSTPVVDTTRVCSAINGIHVQIDEAFHEFAQVHHSPAYRMDKILLRRISSHLRDEILSRRLPYDDEMGEKPDVKLTRSGEAEAEVEGDNGPLNQSSTLQYWIEEMEKDLAPTSSAAIDKIYHHRRIYRTKDRNLVGIGPKDIERGDVVCLVAGAPTPFVFRRVNGGTESSSTARLGTVKLVGSTYLHGVMYGEMGAETRDSYEAILGHYQRYCGCNVRDNECTTDTCFSAAVDDLGCLLMVEYEVNHDDIEPFAG